MLHDIILRAAPALVSVLVLGLIALCAWLSALLASHIKNRRYAAAITLLAYGAAGIVADLAQTTVAALKDPTKPGRWDAVAAAAAKLKATDLLRQLYPLAIGFVTQVLRDPSKVDALLSTLLERAVVDLKAKAPSALAALPAGAELTVDAAVHLDVPAPVVASIHRASTLPMGAPTR